MNKQLIAAIIIIVIITAGGFFLYKNYKNKINAPSSNSSTTFKPSLVHEPVSKITVTATEFSFSPSTIVAYVNKPLTVTLKNNGKYPHNFTITGIGATKTVAPGESETETFTPKKVGSYPFSCTIDSHAKKGMMGMLMVK